MELAERIALVERAVVDAMQSSPTAAEERMIRAVTVAVVATFETYQVEADEKS